MSNEKQNESAVEAAQTRAVLQRQPPGEVRGIADVVEHGTHVVVDPFAPVVRRSGEAVAELTASAIAERDARIAELEAKVAAYEALLAPAEPSAKEGGQP